MQMMCGLLVFGTPGLPRPLADLSPWLDMLTAPRDEVYALLEGQQHRRFIKTHTPLDGVPLDPNAVYIVVARHPLDMAVSLYHQGDNIDHDRMRELTGGSEPAADRSARPSLHDWLLRWTQSQADPRESMDSLPGVMWHLADAWARRDEPNIHLFHYDDLLADLDGEMRRLAGLLGITVSDDVWPDLVRAATFDKMKGRAEHLLPNRHGVFKDIGAFFRQGRSGSGTAVLSDDELDAYHARAAELAPPDVLNWLHRGR